LNKNPTIYVVDDDHDVRDSLQVLLEFADYQVRTFESAVKFLAADLKHVSGCLVVDIRMPDMDGLELQDELLKRKIDLPVIVITGHGDVPLAVRAMRAGAVDFLEKPFREEALLESIQRALRHKPAPQDTKSGEVTSRLEALTDREREVLNLVVEGHTNKEVARLLDISPRTVDIHRAHVMEKMQADTLADLVRMSLSVQRS
jgi:two-component system response regulator FixJ